MSRKISLGKTKTTAAKETLYTVPTKQTALWTLLYVANIGANNKTATVYWYDKSTNEEYGIVNAPFNTGTGSEWGGDNKYVVMEEGDEIRIAIEDNLTTFTFIVSLELDPKLAVQFNA
jgi:hypothetical protein